MVPMSICFADTTRRWQAAFDINYSPASNAKHWFMVKQHALGRFLRDATSNDAFDKYLAR